MARSFKRQFQPSISSYFGRLTSNADDTHPADPAPPIRSPTLPANVQSSLLNVGMRVRKSVSEGYQTKAKMATSYGHTTTYSGLPLLPEDTRQENEPTPAYRGLVPYCGILKIGGHSAQPVPAEEDIPPLQFDDDWSLPSSSQASNTSSVMAANTISAACITSITTKKRRREDADDEDLGLESQPVSPRSRPISHTRMPNLNQICPIAFPKSRRKSSSETEDIGGGMRESEMIDVGDFGEAPFFRPEEWGENWR